jgi:hypothetical protein
MQPLLIHTDETEQNPSGEVTALVLPLLLLLDRKFGRFVPWWRRMTLEQFWQPMGLWLQRLHWVMSVAPVPSGL